MTHDNELPPDPPDPAQEFCIDDETDTASEPEPVDPEPDPQPSPAPSTVALERDTTCRHCGYNLRGLNPGGVCPECGAAIAISLRRDLLRYAAPGYVRSLAWGARTIAWGELLAVAANSSCGPCVTGGSAVLQLIAGSVVLVGLWRLTAPDPSGNDYSRGRTAPLIVRIAQSVSLILAVFAALIHVRGAIWIGPFLLVGLVAGSVTRIALLYRIGQLGVCIPDCAITAECRYLRFVLGLVVAIPIGSSVAPFPLNDMFGVGIIGVVILYLVAEIWFIAIAWRLGTLFHKQIFRATLDGQRLAE